MQSSLQIVEVSQIDYGDTTFRISTSDASSLLIHSIDKLGLINPPVFLPKSDRYRIVSGFARVHACMALKHKRIQARILEPQTSLKTCVQQAVIDNSFQRTFNLVEQARVVRLLFDAYRGMEAIVAVAQGMGIKINAKMATKLLTVGQMPAILQQGLASGAIALPLALQFNSIKDIENIKKLSSFFIELNVSLSRQRKLFEWIVAITRRDQISIDHLLSEKPLQMLRQDSQLERRQKVSLIWQYLNRRRAPASSFFMDDYTNMIKQLKLKKNVRLLAPSNFEGQTYSLQFDFSNLDEMKGIDKELARIIQSPQMAKILKLIQK